ncbi:MAG TPA: CvpA family protein [Chthoniobacterales bacterium]|jgi:uncharacterized membrane protein required for colicin V production
MNPPLAPAPGSHLWQLVFISFAVVLVLFEVLRGWNRGVARQLARLAALIAAYFAAFFGGTFMVPLARPFVNLPDRIVSIAAGAVLALVIYAIINGIAAVMFKKTKQYDSAAARTFCGLGGAVIGVFFGFLLVWMMVVGVRSLGSIADARIRQEAAGQTSTASDRTLHAVDIRRRLAGEAPEENSTVMASLARLKNSLELGSVGDIVKKTDVVPEQTYETLGKIGQVVSNPETAERFLSFPGAQQLSTHPRIVALRNDPEIAALIEQGRYIDLLQNQRIIDALNDPTLTDQIRKFDLQRALEYSIQSR